MAPAALITPRALATPVIRLVERNLGGTNDPSTATGTATGSAAAASSTTIQNSNYGWGQRGNILNWAAIAVVLGLMIAIAGWRLATVRHRSFKGIFLPKGLDFKIFGKRVYVSPPPAPPARPTLQQIELERRNMRAEERFQRRRTRGDNIGEGGQRNEGRDSIDEDDGADTETLPGYKADTTAPIYLEEWREQAVERGEVPAIDPETEDAIRASGPVVREGAEGEAAAQSAGSGDAGEERIMSVAEYEARSRGVQVDAELARTTESAVTQVPLSSPTGVTPTSATALAPTRPQPARVHSGQPPMYETGRQE